ncbi:MAG: hypothetical protein KDJ37_01305 [Hyphomicrobiaceae bacterium]|nr:hypothetical protein [Hyphomicrobiaceae bacterium]
MRRTVAIAILAAVLLPADRVLAKDKASFIDGSYATEEGCAKLKALAAGTPRSVETVPEVLTAEGFKGWEGSCEFTKIYEHDPGKSWVAVLFCVEGATMTPLTYAFARNDDGTIEVGGGSEPEPELFRKCDAGGEKK